MRALSVSIEFGRAEDAKRAAALVNDVLPEDHVDLIEFCSAVRTKVGLFPELSTDAATRLAEKIKVDFVGTPAGRIGDAFLL